MGTGTVTSKGQITIPKDVREDLGLEPGSRIAFVRNDEGNYEIHRERRSVRALAGALRFTGRPRTLEEMDKAIAEGAGM